jgi:hypothetical protein
VVEYADIESSLTSTHEWCTSINDIDHVRCGSLALIDDFIRDVLTTDMAELQKKSFIKMINFTANAALDTNKNKMSDFIHYVARKMSSNIQMYLMVGAIDVDFRDRLMIYLNNVLATFNNHLDESNFHKVLNAIWLEICKILNNLSEIGFTVSE